VSGLADPFNGHIDEFRIAHVQRSDGWIETTWNNLSDPRCVRSSSCRGAGRGRAAVDRRRRRGRLPDGVSTSVRCRSRNVAVAQDPAGDLKPAKDKSTERIDGIVAAIMAIGRAGFGEIRTRAETARFEVRVSRSGAIPIGSGGRSM
jgi:hypothetical protein